MSKILLLHPGKWGRGMTPIWVASHSAVLKSQGHTVEYFDSTFFLDWTVDENTYNTKNQQYLDSDYNKSNFFSNTPIIKELQDRINDFNPDVIFWSAISSHIHGEGEYSAIEFGYELLSKVATNAVKVAGGLQATADPIGTSTRFPDIDFLILGESDLVLAEFLDKLPNSENIAGIFSARQKSPLVKQSIIEDMNVLPAYDYSIFPEMALLRPYNGEVLRAVDYELSRGCPFTCGYCVETVIQKYYGFHEHTSKGVLKGANKYLRHKSAERIFEEISYLYDSKGIRLIRTQDTNFLTIDRKTLTTLADLMEDKFPDLKIYIETRPEGITKSTALLLKRLKVDGVGMGIELAEPTFRMDLLNRFSEQDRIIDAFEILHEAGIKRTAYNVIGFPFQTEESIKNTITFNKKLNPDNITVAFFSPYIGTQQQVSASNAAEYAEYNYSLDAQIRTKSLSNNLPADILNFYKENFVKLVRQ
ncbi:B12-binding domain-containing radical SAM protein [Polynucleobacter paneuropaeus]|nr:B12-binding domain-containing radical SAM protein [Polynucleobacter paneuropaeus]